MQSSSDQPSRKRASFTATTGSWWRNLALPALPVLACFLGGATQKWSEGIIVALLGVILLVDPPRRSLGPALNTIFLALVACALTAFLPAGWFSLPGWRQVMVTDFNIGLPGTLSPQPWITLGCFVSFLAALSWLYYMSAVDLELRAVRTQLRMFATGVVLLAGLCLALYYAKTALPFWHNERNFGPFPNRNQTANLFGLTAIVVLACAQDDIRHGRKRWIFWALGLGALVTAIIINFSRAGVLILVAGCGLWLGAFALRKGSAARIALGISVLLVLLTVMLLFGGQTFERFNLRSGEGSGGLATDLRWAIFRDALQLIRASPWPGIGLGNFDEVFAVFRDASLTSARTIHPESDWFWLWVEMGWPAVLLTIAGIAFLVRRVFPLTEGTNQRFRVAALIAVILFALHGIIDVSAHRIGTVFAAVFLLGLALKRPAELRPSVTVVVLFRLIGVVLFMAGTAWIFATRYEKGLPGAVGVEKEMRRAAAANRGRNFNETIERTTRAIEWAPLKWQLYFSRALGKVGANRPPSDALDDFRRARFLEPNVYEVPFQEGIAWLTTEPSLAFTAWREALRRAGPQRSEVYGRMLALSTQHNPRVHRSLEEFGMIHHDLALIFLEHASGAPFMSALQRFLEHDPDLRSFTPEERSAFFSTWAARGDLNALVREAELHPDWMKDAWPGVARYHAQRKDFRAAFELSRRFAKPPALPQAAEGSSLDQLRQAFHASPDSYAIGFQLYHEQMRLGKIDEALLTVRHFTEMSGAPNYFHFLEAEAWAAKENWERAWQAWQKFQSARTP
jgi:tetratricopeptide (TPR) repeat protein